MKTPEFPTEHMKTLAEAFLRDGLDGHRMVVSVAMDAHAALRAALAEVTAVCRESNAVCACGCPESGHESYGEDGESCGVEGHECVRTSRTVAGMLVTLRAALAEAQRERDEARNRREQMAVAFVLHRLTTGGLQLDVRAALDFGTNLAASVGTFTTPGVANALRGFRSSGGEEANAALARAESAERELAEVMRWLSQFHGSVNLATVVQIRDRIGAYLAREAKPEGEKL